MQYGHVVVMYTHIIILENLPSSGKWDFCTRYEYDVPSTTTRSDVPAAWRTPIKLWKVREFVSVSWMQHSSTLSPRSQRTRARPSERCRLDLDSSTNITWDQCWSFQFQLLCAHMKWRWLWSSEFLSGIWLGSWAISSCYQRSLGHADRDMASSSPDQLHPDSAHWEKRDSPYDTRWGTVFSWWGHPQLMSM